MATEPATPPTAPILEATVEGLKQGVGMMIPLELALPEGETDTTTLEFAATDRALLKLYQRVVVRRSSGEIRSEGLEFRFELTTENGGVVLIPRVHVIELYLSGAATAALEPTADGTIALFGTLFLDDATGNPRPCSGIDLSLPIEPSYL